MHKFSNICPKVSRSNSKPSGSKFNRTVAIEGSMNYHLSDDFIADFDRIFGFQAGMSTVTNNLERLLDNDPMWSKPCPNNFP